MECYTRLKWVKREHSLPQMLDLSLPKCFSGSFVNRTQNSSKSSKPLQWLHFERWSVVHPPSNGDGLRDIQHSMSMVLYTRFIFDSLIWQFITKYDRCYYKCDSFLITKCDKSLLQYASDFYYKRRQFYYKMRQLLQTATVQWVTFDGKKSICQTLATSMKCLGISLRKLGANS